MQYHKAEAPRKMTLNEARLLCHMATSNPALPFAMGQRFNGYNEAVTTLQRHLPAPMPSWRTDFTALVMISYANAKRRNPRG